MRDAIIVQNLGKWFNRYHTAKPVTIMEAALSGLRGMRPVDRFWALRNISFTVAPGEMLGIIGHNGAGKSTLLQLIGGVGRPNEGKVKVNGRIGALLDLGAGFHGDLTGRENVFVTAIVAGLTEREVARRFDQIVEFAELEGFIDNPVRTYSTGMQMRLAFSVAVHTEPDILLVDEFLSVGDLAFQAKCLDRIRQLKRQGCAIVLISHDAEQVKTLCDRAMWLRKGQILAYGEPEGVVSQYINEMQAQTLKRTPLRSPLRTQCGQELRVNENRFGSLEVEIANVHLLPNEHINGGEPLEIEVEYFAPEPIESPIFCISICHENGSVCLDTNTQVMGIPTPILQGTGRLKFYCDRLDLGDGKYFVDVGIFERHWEYAYDYHHQAYPMWVHARKPGKGILMPPMRWEFMVPTSRATIEVKG